MHAHISCASTLKQCTAAALHVVSAAAVGCGGAMYICWLRFMQPVPWRQCKGCYNGQAVFDAYAAAQWIMIWHLHSVSHVLLLLAACCIVFTMQATGPLGVLGCCWASAHFSMHWHVNEGSGCSKTTCQSFKYWSACAAWHAVCHLRGTLLEHELTKLISWQFDSCCWRAAKGILLRSCNAVYVYV